jgi:hypothetical protein
MSRLRRDFCLLQSIQAEYVSHPPLYPREDRDWLTPLIRRQMERNIFSPLLWNRECVDISLSPMFRGMEFNLTNEELRSLVCSTNHMHKNVI